MKRDFSLSELKTIENKILIFFDKVCRDNNLRYSLDYGTLLGAIRHGGFIPWDDDIDVSMPRNDYDKLCRILADNIDDRYHLYAAETNKSYLYPYAKLVDSYTDLEELNIDCGVPLGVWIDIFPYDFDINDKVQVQQEKKEFMKKEVLLDYCMSRKHRSKGIKRVICIFIDLFLKIIGKRYFTNMHLKFAKKYQGKDTGFINVRSGFYDPQNIIKKDAFNDLIEVEFENRKYYAFSFYEEYLKNIYGNYMEFPPEKDRIPHHVFKAYWKNKVEQL